jgi:hypothetical protein
MPSGISSGKVLRFSGNITLGQQGFNLFGCQT